MLVAKPESRASGPASKANQRNTLAPVAADALSQVPNWGSAFTSDPIAASSAAGWRSTDFKVDGRTTASFCATGWKVSEKAVAGTVSTSERMRHRQERPDDERKTAAWKTPFTDGYALEQRIFRPGNLGARQRQRSLPDQTDVSTLTGTCALHILPGSESLTGTMSRAG